MINTEEPVLVFTSWEHAQRVLDYWIDKLLLRDWIIKVRLVKTEDISDPNSNFLKLGTNCVSFECKSCVISIAEPDKNNSDCVLKYCAEQTLVHELLHCIYNLIENKDTYEGTMFDLKEHQQLEQLSKTLIMVKYNLPLDWFRNR